MVTSGTLFRMMIRQCVKEGWKTPVKYLDLRYGQIDLNKPYGRLVWKHHSVPITTVSKNYEACSEKELEEFFGVEWGRRFYPIHSPIATCRNREENYSRKLRTIRIE